MKTLFVCAVGAAFLLGSSAFAADSKPLSQNSQRLTDFWKQADTNKDGSVSKAEWEAFLKARFDSFDKNHDGKLSADEVTAMLSGMGSAQTMTAAEYIGQKGQDGKPYDADGDGMISQKEYLDRSMSRFDVWDLNHDGTISPDEQKAEISRMEAMPAH